MLYLKTLSGELDKVNLSRFDAVCTRSELSVQHNEPVILRYLVVFRVIGLKGMNSISSISMSWWFKVKHITLAPFDYVLG